VLAGTETETETEDAPWSAVTDPNTTYPWGLGVFDVDPGRDRVRHFTATRTRSDGFGFRERSLTA
jgi:hypothetical protein